MRLKNTGFSLQAENVMEEHRGSEYKLRMRYKSTGFRVHARNAMEKH